MQWLVMRVGVLALVAAFAAACAQGVRGVRVQVDTVRDGDAVAPGVAVDGKPFASLSSKPLRSPSQDYSTARLH